MENVKLTTEQLQQQQQETQQQQSWHQQYMDWYYKRQAYYAGQYNPGPGDDFDLEKYLDEEVEIPGYDFD